MFRTCIIQFQLFRYHGQTHTKPALSSAATCDAVSRSYEPPLFICSNIVATTGSNFSKTAQLSARLAQRVVHTVCKVPAKSSPCKTDQPLGRPLNKSVHKQRQKTRPKMFDGQIDLWNRSRSTLIMPIESRHTT